MGEPQAASLPLTTAQHSWCFPPGSVGLEMVACLLWMEGSRPEATWSAGAEPLGEPGVKGQMRSPSRAQKPRMLNTGPAGGSKAAQGPVPQVRGPPGRQSPHLTTGRTLKWATGVLVPERDRGLPSEQRGGLGRVPSRDPPILVRFRWEEPRWLGQGQGWYSPG